MSDDIEKKNNPTKTFQGTLGEYQEVITEDGSRTFYSSFFEEAFHNVSGAFKETEYVYLEGCEVERLLRPSFATKNFSILEVGFGMGLGLFAFDQYLSNYLVTHSIDSFPLNINFDSFEIDIELMKYIMSHSQFKFSILPQYQDWILKDNAYEITKIITLKNFRFQFNGKIYLGDGRKIFKDLVAKNISKNYHAIFQDPFSPRKNPDLWSVEWFSDLYKLSSDDVILSTYSASNSIRKGLLESKWSVFERKGFGNKKAMTVAKKSGKMNEELLSRLARSPINPITDHANQDYLESREERIGKKNSSTIKKS